MSTDTLDTAGQRYFRAIALIYFAVFVAHSGWRATLQNHAVDNLGFDGRELGLLFAIGHIPGVLAFTLGFASTRLPLRQLLLLACCCLAGGLLLAGVATSLTMTAPAALLIAVGFTAFQALAVAGYLITSPATDPSAHLGTLRSLGPLAGLSAGLVILAIFTPPPWSEVSIDVDRGEHSGAWLQWLFSRPPVATESIRSLFLVSGLLLLGIALTALPRLQDSQAMATRGRLHLRRSLTPYYLLNGIAGCRSAIFQVFLLHIMIRQFKLPIQGTAALMMLGYCFSFIGYRAMGRVLTRCRHRTVLTALYLVVATNFALFWAVTGLTAPPLPILTLLGLLFLIDSLLFGASVVTDSHLRKTGRQRDFIGDVSTGATVFHTAALLMSLAAAALWQPWGHHGVLLGTLVCLLGALISRHLDA